MSSQNCLIEVFVVCLCVKGSDSEYSEHAGNCSGGYINVIRVYGRVMNWLSVKLEAKFKLQTPTANEMTVARILRGVHSIRLTH
jgi:hypothetical protein